jgi:hypothetical protein
MNGEPDNVSFTSIDVRCRQPNCTCARSVPGTIVTEGYAVAPEVGPQCPACLHPWSNHETLGLSKGPVETGEPIT